MESLLGKTLKRRYRVDESLGRGGMAEVYKVWDEERAVYLAMKVLRQDLAQDPIFLRRFQREAKALAALQHPHIVRFYGLERDDLLAFLLMEYVDGVSLQAEILRSAGKSLPMEHIREVMEAVCSALHYAHHQGLVHCDIKPGNILIDKHGQIYLTDFGIARGMDAATSTLIGIGTPAYMAPELIKGQDPTPQTDIYALGIVLYEMLTGGERPFTGERATITGTTVDKVRWEHLKLEPIPVSQFNPKVSGNFQFAVDQCLQKKIENRFSSVDVLMRSLQEKNKIGHLIDNEEKAPLKEKDAIKNEKDGNNQFSEIKEKSNKESKITKNLLNEILQSFKKRKKQILNYLLMRSSLLLVDFICIWVYFILNFSVSSVLTILDIIQFAESFIIPSFLIGQILFLTSKELNNKNFLISFTLIYSFVKFILYRVFEPPTHISNLIIFGVVPAVIIFYFYKRESNKYSYKDAVIIALYGWLPVWVNSMFFEITGLSGNWWEWGSLWILNYFPSAINLVMVESIRLGLVIWWLDKVNDRE